jgi:N-methylhydantoinase B
VGLNVITLEVLQNRFEVIADEMEVALLRASFSPIVKEGLDASAALFTPAGEVITQAAAIPIHLGCLIPTVKRIVAEFPVAMMAEGDAYIMNDPYDGGTHLPDTTIVQPIFHRGAVVALAATMTHNQDIGGKAPGSIPTDATEIYQEGLCLPPLKFYDRGQPNTTLHALLRKNVRLPDVCLGDLHGQIAAGHVGMRRFVEVVEDYGLDTVNAAVAELMDRAEAATRARVQEIPDGTYRFSDYLDNDGVVLDRRLRISVAVVVQGSEVLFDFTGTSPQAAGPVNSVASATVSGAYYVLRCVTDPLIPNNSGCYRMVRFVLPEGSLVNPRHPAPVNARTPSPRPCPTGSSGLTLGTSPWPLAGSIRAPADPSSPARWAPVASAPVRQRTASTSWTSAR